MNKQILIVEDDEMIQQMIKLHLHSEGYQATAVSTGAAMFASLAAHPCDLIILDLGLPDGDGLTLAQHFRVKSNIPIIVVTSRHGADDRVMALGIGVNDYLTKPFDPRELLLRITNVLQAASVQPANAVPPQIPGAAIPLAQPVDHAPVQQQVHPQYSAQPSMHQTSMQGRPMSRAGDIPMGQERRERRTNQEGRKRYKNRRMKYILIGLIAVVVSISVTALVTLETAQVENAVSAPQQGELYVKPSPSAITPVVPNPEEEKVVTVTLESPRSSATFANPPEETPKPVTLQSTDNSWITKSNCDEIPQVDWWTIKTHISVVNYVQRKFDGDFAQYYDSWTGRLNKMEDIYARGSGAVTRTKVILRGEGLLSYITQIKKRLEIIKCLSSAAVEADPANHKVAN